MEMVQATREQKRKRRETTRDEATTLAKPTTTTLVSSPSRALIERIARRAITMEKWVNYKFLNDSEFLCG